MLLLKKSEFPAFQDKGVTKLRDDHVHHKLVEVQKYQQFIGLDLIGFNSMHSTPIDKRQARRPRKRKRV